MYCRKTPRITRTRRAAPGATDGVCFLLVTFSFHKKRKVTRSRQRAKQKADRKDFQASTFDLRQQQIPHLRLGMTIFGATA
jgi:hypothetical protein